ncbi:thiolase family [Rhizoctonia solani]|uniref:Thiolase family n=1 Tax=Rhizoctonia solani TaxID=456999 RepID=A0A8H7LY64_9AGAM|nr:thiolase family [Rhizoctonia solani]
MAAAAARTQAYIVAAKRTPFGAFGGKLKDLKASELGGLAGKAALATLPKETKVDSVIFGSVSQTDNSGAYVARHVGHYSGLPVTVPALTVNRFGNTRYGVDQKLVDSLAAALIDQVPGGHPGAAPTPMGVTAENLAQKYGITREQCDAYALRSQQRWAAAQEAGAFNDEISPVELKGKKGLRSSVLTNILAPRNTGSSRETSHGIGDGAAANVVASEAACQQYNLPKLARIVSYGISACEPSIMGIGPVEAIKIALSRAGLKKDDIDLWDVNEAFAAQWLAVQKELELPDEISNVFGGAIALAHPLGASGARITANLVHNLRRLNKRYGVGAACIGGGQGIALVLEKA